MTGTSADVDIAESYRALPGEAAEMFRVLGLHPGPAFHVGAAAALAGVDVKRARQLLGVVEAARLVEEVGPGRYELTERARSFAREQTEGEEAVRRVLEWYLHSAGAAQAHFDTRERLHLEPPLEGGTPMSFADYADAVRWYEEERENLMAAVRAAEATGMDRIAWQLPAVLRAMHMRFNPFEEWLAMGEIGLRAARRSGDRVGEGELLDSLGLACLRSHRLAEAADYAHAGIVTQRELGNGYQEALALNNLGLVRMRQRDFDVAEDLFGQALAMFTELDSARSLSPMENLATVAYERGDLVLAGERVTQAMQQHAEATGGEKRGNALRILSAVQREQGERELALRTIQSALDTADSRVREGYWLLELGAAQQAVGQPGEALVSYQRSAVIHRRLGDRAREARAWQGAGEAYRAMERYEEAADFHRMAARVQREIGDGWQLAIALDGLARAALALGEDEMAWGRWGEALAALEAFADARAVALRERIGAELARWPS